MISYAMEREHAHHLARSLRVPFVDLKDYTISPGVLRKLSRDVVKRFRCVPMVCNHRRVVLVGDNPADAIMLATDPSLLDLPEPAAPASRRRVEFALTTASALEATVARRLAIPD